MLAEFKRVTRIAERVKGELILAIAASRIFEPTATDQNLIKCFAVGEAGHAFNVVRHAVYFRKPWR